MMYAIRVFTCLLVVNGLSSALAQGLRVEAQVYRIDRDPASGRVAETRLSNSVTFFHSGRVYDYVESADEVIIFEPTARRFTILNTARELTTTADFDEIKHLIKFRRTESKRYLQEFRGSGSPDADKVVRSLEFQLDPKFDTKFDSAVGLLTMTSPAWKYRVQTHAWQDADQVKVYLTYADWISQLNYVLDPASMFPEPRMLLNSKLCELDRMPTTVSLDLEADESVGLRAEHKFIKDLTDDDQHLIQAWDSAVGGGSLRKLSLRSYQEAVLVSQR
jgi:hypothetical protein